MNGDPATLPRDARGHAAILVFGFSKAATEVTRPWLEGCRSGATAHCYDVRMLESVPRPFRSMVERGMRSGFPPELRRDTILVYTNNDPWRELLGATDEATAYVVAIDSEGIVRATATGTFTAAKLGKLFEASEHSEPGR